MGTALSPHPWAIPLRRCNNLRLFLVLVQEAAGGGLEDSLQEKGEAAVGRFINQPGLAPAPLWTARTIAPRSSSACRARRGPHRT